jgi:3-isopropylmalate/(R)-2-methylmalate dehydratase small subunit
MKIKGTCIKYGDNINTDVIIPARYLNTFDADELGRHCMEDLDASFHARLKGGDIIAAGKNFGCGSSREHAPLAIKANGDVCVIAKSIARIFYSNAVNIGLPIVESPEAAEECASGDVFEIDFEAGEARNLTRGKSYNIEPFPPFLSDIIRCGGLMNMAKNMSGGSRE